MAGICEEARACFTAILFVEMQELLLGFDAREMWMAQEDLMHPSHKRSTFLLRDDVRKALSADTLVWPSIFGSEQEFDER